MNADQGVMPSSFRAHQNVQTQFIRSFSNVTALLIIQCRPWTAAANALITTLSLYVI